MRKGVLFLLGMFMMVSYVEAKNGKKSAEIIGVENRYSDAVTFVERGIKFHVFLNGDFDFDSGYIRRRNRRILIYRDDQGRIKRVGNVYINYDRRGNVRKIGSIYMRYHRGRLTRFGNLQVRYNRWGNPRFYGQVPYTNYYNDYYYDDYSAEFNVNIGAICAYNDPYFYRSEFRNNYRRFREDDNFYYYRAKKNAKVSRDKILRRRKPVKKAISKRA
ncbi:MAG: hypothetical protein GKR88_01630 [Flavobacteriaceae bacterium]|nr:MAG: hypothetical protein GKR88_01630 [Flavobacteriaceae bacterium]